MGPFAVGRVCARCLLEAGLSDSALDASAWDEDEADLNRLPIAQVGRFGHYELLEEIGHGGMGVVFRARDVALNRIVALKLILAGQFASEREVKRFRAEAEAAARLDHPNIVPIYEVGEQHGRPFFSMKLMEGGTLIERLAQGTAPMDPRQAASLLVKVARAVHHAHQRAILHRDLKPGNILLDAQAEPHVSDFGLAKCLDHADGLTVSGATLGSPSYMSPEQATGQPDRLTTASDTYSLGALLYQLLTNRPPFAAATPLAVLEKVLHEEPLPPQAIRPGTDLDLATICLKCLEKDPQRRYASADALAVELERWLRGEPIQARPCPVWTRFWKWTRRQPRVALLALVSTLAILALVLGQAMMSLRLTRANTEVRATNTRLSASLYELRWRRADEASRVGERDEAIAWFCYFLRQNPQDSVAAARLLSLLASCNFPVPLVSPLMHDAPVVEVDFSRTGDRLATATSGKTARVWSTQSGQLESELAHPAPLAHCALGGENDLRLLTISTEPKARLWDLSRRQLIKEIPLGPVDERAVGRLVLRSRDRRLMALNVQSNVIAVFDAQSGTWIAPSLSLPTEICQFALTEDGRLLATGTRSGVQLWTVSSQQALFAPVPLTAQPEGLLFSDDGRRLACSGQDKIWVMNTGTGARESEFNAKASAIAFIDNTEQLIIKPRDLTAGPVVFNFRNGQDCGSLFGHPGVDWVRQASLAALLLPHKSTDRIHLLDHATGQPRVEPFFHDGWILNAKPGPNGRTVATASQDRSVRIWSVEMGKADPITLQTRGPVWEAQWSSSSERILSTSKSETGTELRLWDAHTGALVTPPGFSDGMVYFAQWVPDASRFATTSQDFSARLWDGQTGKAISSPLRHNGMVTYCVFSPDGSLLATTADDGTVRLWDGRTGQAISPPLPHSHVPLKAAFSRDSRRLATACQDGTIRIWSVPDGTLALEPLHHGGTCYVAAFSPDDRLLVSASSDGTVQLWNAETGKPALAPFRHEGPVLWASFSPNGRAIATSTESGIARVWETATGQPLSEPMRHPATVWFVKWSPDGRFLATTCTDGSARIWDAFTGHRVAEPFSHQQGEEVRRAEFSPDGRRLLTASLDGTAKIWELTFLRPPVPVPDWLPDLAEALGGKRIGAKDAPESVPGDTLQRVKRDLKQARGQDAYYAAWAKWMLEERLESPVPRFQP